jgi:hypothetical protein
MVKSFLPTPGYIYAGLAIDPPRLTMSVSPAPIAENRGEENGKDGRLVPPILPGWVNPEGCEKGVKRRNAALLTDNKGENLPRRFFLSRRTPRHDCQRSFKHTSAIATIRSLRDQDGVSILIRAKPALLFSFQTPLRATKGARSPLGRWTCS